MRPLSGLPIVVEAPSALIAGVAIAGCVGLFVAMQQDLSSFSVYDAGQPSASLGTRVIAVASAESLFKVALALCVAVAVVCLLMAVSLPSHVWHRRIRNTLRLLANAPVMMLLPMWLVALGNSEAAAFVFLVYCMTVMLGFTVFEDSAGGAQLVRRMIESLSLDTHRRLSLVVEAVLATMRQSIFQILMLGMPLALAAEMINNQSGLGFLASNSFSNANFRQLTLIAGAYVVSFCALWLAWIALLSLFLRIAIRPAPMGGN